MTNKTRTPSLSPLASSSPTSTATAFVATSSESASTVIQATTWARWNAAYFTVLYPSAWKVTVLPNGFEDTPDSLVFSNGDDEEGYIDFISKQDDIDLRSAGLHLASSTRNLNGFEAALEAIDRRVGYTITNKKNAHISGYQAIEYDKHYDLADGAGFAGADAFIETKNNFIHMWIDPGWKPTVASTSWSDDAAAAATAHAIINSLTLSRNL